MNVTVKDCSPFEPQPSADEVLWLKALQKATVDSHVVGLGSERDEDEPIVYSDGEGTWWAGRYIGSLTFQGRTLTVQPRFGIDTVQRWLMHANRLALVETPGATKEDGSFVARLLALIWGRRLVEAARHGVPALRRDVGFRGTEIRGRIDVRGTAALFAAGRRELASQRREKSLEHAVSRAIVAAWSALRRWLRPGEEWTLVPERVRDLLPLLQAATGLRPGTPTLSELRQVRHTPITQPFQRVAELSVQIAAHRGLTVDASASGECEGILLDVAEVWELYVIAVFRAAAPGFEVVHGTVDDRHRASLFRSAVDGTELGRIKPDALLLRSGKVVAIVDAKYKRLAPSPRAPGGVQREDLYQLAAYVTRFSTAAWGALVYPIQSVEPPLAERRNPWFGLDTKVMFTTLPHELDAAIARARAALPLLTV